MTKGDGKKAKATEEKRTADAQAQADRRKRQDALLDEALQETFPASDPVSIVTEQEP